MSEIIASDRAPPELRHSTARSRLSALPLRMILAALGLAALAIWLPWQWHWLVAVGVAPILISVAPCLLMCALGLCMTKAKVGSCRPGGTQSSNRFDETAAAAPPPDARH